MAGAIFSLFTFHFSLFFVPLRTNKLKNTMKRIFSLLSVVLLAASSTMAQRQVETLNFDWQFSRDASFKNASHVDVPHDFQISQPWGKKR